MPKVWTERDYLRATSLVGDVQDPETKRQLQQKIADYEQGRFQGAPTGAGAIEAADETLPARREPAPAQQALPSGATDITITDRPVTPEELDKVARGDVVSQMLDKPRSVGDAAVPTPWYEPSLDVFRQEMAPILGERVEQITESHPLYREYADRKWAAAHDQAAASGESLTRVSELPGESWTDIVGNLPAQALPYIQSLALGAEETGLAGLGTELLGRGVENLGIDPEGRQKLEEGRAWSPVARGVGNVLGVLNPFSPAMLAGTAAARAVGPALGGLATRAGGGLAARAGARAGTAAAAGGAGLAAEGAAQELVPEFLGTTEAGTEEAITGANPFDPGGFLARRGEEALVGAAGGLAAEPVGALAQGMVRRLRRGRRGQALAEAERAGLATTSPVSGVKFSEGMEDIARRAEGAGIKPREQAARDVREGLTTEAAKKKTTLEEELGAINEAYYKSPEGRLRFPAANLQKQLMDELDKLAPRGETLPGAETLVRKLQGMLKQSTRDGVTGARGIDARQLDTIAKLIDDMAEDPGRARAGIGDEVFARLQRAIREDRDAWPENDVTLMLTDGQPRTIGDPLTGETKQVRGWSAAKSVMEQEIEEMTGQLGAAGFPAGKGQRFGPGPEGQTAWSRLGKISGAQDRVSAALTSEKADTREALRRIAQDAGLERELSQVHASLLKEALSEPELYGRLYAMSGGRVATLLSLGSRHILERTDPIFRKLAEKLQAMPISPELRSAIYGARGGRGPNPFRASDAGKPGGVVASPATPRDEFLGEMTPEEAEALLQVIVERSRPQEAAPEESAPAGDDEFEEAPMEEDEEFVEEPTGMLREPSRTVPASMNFPGIPIGPGGLLAAGTAIYDRLNEPEGRAYEQDGQFMAMLAKIEDPDVAQHYIENYGLWRELKDEAIAEGEVHTDPQLFPVGEAPASQMPYLAEGELVPRRSGRRFDTRGFAGRTDNKPSITIGGQEDLAGRTAERVQALIPEQRADVEKRLGKDWDDVKLVRTVADMLAIGSDVPSSDLVISSLDELGYNVADDRVRQILRDYLAEPL